MSGAAGHAYWVTAPGQGQLRAMPAPAPADHEHSILIATHSGISPGTERLVGTGQVPPRCAEQMSCRYMEGSFDLPIKYGYALVGEATDGQLAGARVFAMHPHQSVARIRNDHGLVLPDAVPSERATLIPNTETALNAVWDARPRLGESTVILGGGPVGLLIAFVLHALEIGTRVLVDPDPERREFAAELDFVDEVLAPEECEPGAKHIAFHTSGTASGLQDSLRAVGFEGRVIDLSWYGTKPVTLELGTDFHYERKRIEASQVAHIAPSRRDTHSHADRLQVVLQLLESAAVDPLLSPPIPFGELPEFMAALYAGRLNRPQPLVAYGQEPESTSARRS